MMPNAAQPTQQPLTRAPAATLSRQSYFVRVRRYHYIGLAVYAGLGLVTMASRDIAKLLMVLAGGVMVYLLVALALRLRHLPNSDARETLSIAADATDVLMLALLMATASGFWAGFAETALDSYGRLSIVDAHLFAATGASSVAAIGLVFVMVSGVLSVGRSLQGSATIQVAADDSSAGTADVARFCHACGARNSSEDSHCRSCGQELR